MEIVGYENYLIYEDGKVYSKVSKRYLKASLNTPGYYSLQLGRGNRVMIHRLVALHYIPNPDNKPCVDHINRDKLDNRKENLRWATYTENGQNTGLQKDNKSGHKNISYDKRYQGYRYVKAINGELHQKYFKTLEEAIEYKEEFERHLFDCIFHQK